jgi:hypothetical protein
VAITVLGIFSYPWPEAYGKGPLRRRTLLELYRKAVWNKANPRREEYMMRVFDARWPEGDYVNVDHDPQWRRRVPSAERVVLLYPDAIGLGFRPIESQILKMKPMSSVYVLNGRKREFRFTPSTRYALYGRRVLERGMVGEAVAVVLFLIATPVLWVIDRIRRHR